MKNSKTNTSMDAKNRTNHFDRLGNSVIQHILRYVPICTSEPINKRFNNLEESDWQILPYKLFVHRYTDKDRHQVMVSLGNSIYIKDDKVQLLNFCSVKQLHRFIIDNIRHFIHIFDKFRENKETKCWIIDTINDVVRIPTKHLISNIDFVSTTDKIDNDHLGRVSARWFKYFEFYESNDAIIRIINTGKCYREFTDFCRYDHIARRRLKKCLQLLFYDKTDIEMELQLEQAISKINLLGSTPELHVF